MTAPTVNVVRALDDHVQSDIDATNDQIASGVRTIAALYQKRAALEALRDLRDAFQPQEVTDGVG